MPQKLTQEQFEQKVHSFHPQYKILSEYINCRNPIDVECENGHTWTTNARNLLSGKGCPDCWKELWVKNIASNNTKYYSEDCIANKRPHLVEYLLNKEDGFKYSFGSGQKIMWKCPFCNSEFEYSIREFSKRGFVCRVCNDGNSFPNRYMYSILHSIGEDFIMEFNSSWSNGYRYDFLLKKYNVIIEMDGHFHYRDNLLSGGSLNEQKEIDLQKDLLAQSNGYEVIRINCNYKDVSDRFKYITNSILESKLSQLLDLNNVDFILCYKKATSPIYYNICTDWENGVRSVSVLSEKYGYDRHTITKHLKQGNDLGICTYNVEDEKLRRNTIQLLCLETGEIFKSVTEAQNKLGFRIKKIDDLNYIGTKNNLFHFKKISYKDFQDLTPNIT